MEAIIQHGKSQFRIKEGDIVLVDKLDHGTEKTIILEKVLLISDGTNNFIGAPYVTNAKVSASIIEDVKGDKVINFRYKPKKGYHRTVGHRQKFTKIEIKKIELV